LERFGKSQAGTPPDREKLCSRNGIRTPTNIKETFGEFEFGPRPGEWGIMQVQIGGSFNNIVNLETGKPETEEIQIKPPGVRFFSGEEISYSLINQYEYLYVGFNISKIILNFPRENLLRIFTR